MFLFRGLNWDVLRKYFWVQNKILKILILRQRLNSMSRKSFIYRPLTLFVWRNYFHSIYCHNKSLTPTRDVIFKLCLNCNKLILPRNFWWLISHRDLSKSLFTFIRKEYSKNKMFSTIPFQLFKLKPPLRFILSILSSKNFSSMKY